MYQRAKLGGALRLSSRKLRRARGRSTDAPYEVPSYWSEKDRRRGKKHPGHFLREEEQYGPLEGGRRGRVARERSLARREIAEPIEEYLAEARGPRHTTRWLGDFSLPEDIRRAQRNRAASTSKAQGNRARAV